MFSGYLTTNINTLLASIFVGYDLFRVILLALLKFIGITKIDITCDSSKLSGVIKQLKRDGYIIGYNYSKGLLKPFGAIITTYCIGDLEYDLFEKHTAHIKLYGFEKALLKLVDNDEILDLALTKDEIEEEEKLPQGPSKNYIKIYTRQYDQKGVYYNPLRFYTNDLKPMGEQKMVVDRIIEEYRKKQRCVVFLSGPSGSGKSVVGLLLAKELNGNYCHTFNPTDPGDSMGALISQSQIEECDDAPLVIVLEEADKLINDVHLDAIKSLTPHMVTVRNKSTFNTFLDDMFMHPRVVLIMTSNTRAEDIDGLDASYLRAGRVHLKMQMEKVIEL